MSSVQTNYDISSLNRGQVIIINNYNFRSPAESRRHFSDSDVIELCNFFENRRFEIDIRRNSTGQQMKFLLSEISQWKEYEGDMLVFIVLSYGSRELVYGTDTMTVSMEEIADNLSLCQPLRGKPKLVLIQACEGIRLQHNEVEESGDSDFQAGPGEAINVTDPDLLMFISTFPGFVRAAPDQSGSLFVHNLCQQLQANGGATKEIKDALDATGAAMTTAIGGAAQGYAAVRRYSVPLVQGGFSKLLHIT